MKVYCTFCGNVKVDEGIKACDSCSEILNGKLKEAFVIYQKLQDEGKCCGGLSWDKDHLYFHGSGSGWSREYGQEPLSIGVEMGVYLHEDHATTYWLFDTDTSIEGIDYGSKIMYNDPDFYENLYKQLDQSAEVAWNSDCLSCDECGYHYHVSNGNCCEKSEIST